MRSAYSRLCRGFQGLLILTVAAALPCEAAAPCDPTVAKIHPGDKSVEIKVSGSSFWSGISDIKDICADKNGEWILINKKTGPKGEELWTKIPRNVDVRLLAAGGIPQNLPFMGGSDPTDAAFLAVFQHVLDNLAVQSGADGAFLYPLLSAADPSLADAVGGTSLGFIGVTRDQGSDAVLVAGSGDASGQNAVVLRLLGTQTYGLEYLNGLPVFTISPTSTVDALNFLTPDSGNANLNFVAFASAVPEPRAGWLFASGLIGEVCLARRRRKRGETGRGRQ